MKLRKEFLLFVVVFCLGVSFSAGSAYGLTYYGYNEFGGGWSDAEKSWNNTDDDLMCWAAAASNILNWTGWGSSYATGAGAAQNIFYKFQTHWTDEGSLPEFSWEWWFNGNNSSAGWPGWSQVEVPGGGYYPSENFFNYFHSDASNWADNFETVRSFLQAGYGTTLAIRGAGDHAITVWGYEYHELLGGGYVYDGIWITDSDDHQNWTVYNPNGLRYTDLVLTDGKWYLEDYFGGGWYIGEVYALDRMQNVPLPATILLLASGVAGLAGLRRRSKKD